MVGIYDVWTIFWKCIFVLHFVVVKFVSGLADEYKLHLYFKHYFAQKSVVRSPKLSLFCYVWPNVECWMSAFVQINLRLLERAYRLASVIFF